MKKINKALSVLLVILMLLTSAPLSGLSGIDIPDLFASEANAAGVSGYSAGAAVQWAKDHWNDYDSVILGSGYWDDGGDCANFVSQCLYMGGLNMNNSWNTSGKWHYSAASNASFINAHNLYSYLTSIGGQAIQNPSANQVSIGDIIFYRTTSDGRMHHSAIVVDFVNGTPVVAAHSTSGNRYYGSAYTLGYSGDRIYLVKMYGATCSVPNPRSFDVYIASNCGAAGRRCYTSPSPYAGYNFTFSAGEYCHVDRVVYEYGLYFGHTYGYGANGWYEGWIHLDNYHYQRHVDSASVSHSMGGWYTESNATCTSQGTNKRVCSKCGYTETQKFGPNGHNWANATCTSAQYCKTCGTKSGSALGHSWGNWTTVTAATCTANGTQKHTCSRCGANETKALNVLGHSWGSNWVSCNNGTHKKVCSRNSSHIQTANCTYGSWKQVKAPTCTDTGLKQRSCTSCGFTQSATIAAIGHNWNEGAVTKNATCIEKGIISYTCRNDQNHTYTGETEINPDNHTGKTHSVNNKNSTCTENGYTGDIHCSSCNKMLEKGENIQAAGHDYKKTVTAPDCTNKGYSTYKCTVCSNSYIDDYTDAKGHDWDDGVVIADSNCYEKGTKKYTCKADDSHTYTEVINIDQTNHTGDTQVRDDVAATCTIDGYTGNTYCLGCNTIIENGEVIKAFGHAWDDGEIISDSTCCEEGIKKYTCKNDSSHTLTETISVDSTNHAGGTQVKDETEATCTTDGYTGNTYCLGCNTILESGEAVKAFGHKWDNGTVISKATCCEEGIKKYTCKNDIGHTYTEAISVDPENHASETQVKDTAAATCTTDGYTGNTYCLGCNEILEAGKVIKAFEHNWGVWENNNNGTHTKICKNDSNHIETTDCNSLSLIFGQSSTCSSTGIERKKCRDCGYIIEKIVPMREHERGGLNIENRISATCTEQGSYDLVYYCGSCGIELSCETHITDASGHDEEIMISEMKIGDTFELGSYPQSEVKDEALLAELNSYELNWINYGYLYGEDDDDDDDEGDMVNTLDMSYAEVTHNGEKYRAVTFSQYRPAYTGGLPDEEYSFQYENGYYVNTIYWFKYEPVSWRVVDPKKGIVFTENIIDSQPFNNYLHIEYSADGDYYACWGDEEKTHSAADYLLSSMPGFLENLYENVMFTEDEKSGILPTTITNGEYFDSSEEWEEGRHIGISDTTSVEYLYLLGLEDIIEDISELKFSFDEGAQNIIKFAPEFMYSGCLDANNTDYAISQGLTCYDMNPAYFWFRDAFDDYYVYSIGYEENEIDYGEYLEHPMPSYYNIVGLRPAMTMDPSYVVATGRTKAVEPTCTESGSTENAVCARCELLLMESSELPALGHEEYVSAEEIAPTCTKVGATQQISCLRCEKVLLESEKIEALGHECNNEWVLTKAPTCLEKGIETAKCIRHDAGATCSETYTRDVDMIPHDLVKTDAVNATCLENGNIEYYACVQCNKYFADENAEAEIEMDSWIITSLGHNEGQWICIDEGYEDFVGYSKADCDTLVPECGFALHFELHCTRCVNENICNEILDEYEIVAADHNMVQSDYKTPTCVEGGYIVNKCTKCDYTESYLTEATDHNWSEWQTEKEAICLHVGSQERHCINDNCNVVENRSIDAYYSEHDYVITETVSTECTAGTNLNHFVCSRCGETECDLCKASETPHYYWDGNPAAHNIQKNNEQSYEPTCTEFGLNVYECINEACKYSYSETVAPLTHDYRETEKTPATCTESGKIYMVCSRNAEHNYVIIDTSATGHAWDNGVIDPESTCNTHGTKTYTCQNDASHTYTEEVALDENKHAGETYIKDTKDATCTEDGYTGDIYCADCDKKLEDGEVIPATNHDWDEWKTVTEATCEEDGLQKRSCKNDASHTEENILPATGHDWNEGVIDPESTCNTHGTKTYTCHNDASHTYTEEVALDENKHAGENYIKDAKDATCTEDGYTGDTYCADCDKKLEDGEIIPATNHDWGEWIVSKESTYTENGEEKRTCSNCGAEETRPLPVLTRPSDENENIETEKTVEYDSATGEAVIKLVASSKGEKITVNSRTPLDIVLVLDQSGSMEGDLLKKLKDATDDFTNAIYQDAVENNIDHRIAMVGFAMQNQYNFGSEYPQYLNTEILTTGGAPVKYNSLSTAKMNEVYRNALVSVNVDGTLNPILTLAKDNLEAKGATAADLGLDMACQIFAQNENDGSRKRIVVFMTDGVPTYKSDYMEETATNATKKANLLKDAYEADLYSVGVLSGSNTSKAKTFLNDIASKDENNKALYFDCADADKLVEDFQTIATQSTTVTTDFADITLIDTVSSAFTLTAVQENELRKNAIEKLGITNDDITITRYEDGTTEVKLEHINPIAVAEGNDINYVIDIDFRVTANEKALIAGSYGTNTDNAGVLIGTTDVYENNFAVPGASVENAEGVIYFTVNGITYHMVRVHKGDTPVSPEFTLDGEYTFSGWDIPDEVVFDGGKLTVDATLTQKEYTVTWNTADGKIVDTYHAGDIIVVPTAGLNAKGEEFLGWDNAVPVTMPAENLEFTASYGKHEHSYTEKVLKKVSCGVEGKVQYICSCADSYTETVAALTHKWSTSATSTDDSETAYSYVYCENCGASPEKTLTYTITGKSGRKEVSYDLKLTDAENITVQPDGNITISLPVPQTMKNASNVKIYRVEEDGSKTNLNGSVKNGYITFTTDHFSIYIIEAAYECDETGKHIDSDCNKVCDICCIEDETLGHCYTLTVTAPTCTQQGFTTYTCECGDSYISDYMDTVPHTDTDGNGTCDFCDRDIVQDDEGNTNNCSHICHKSGFIGFIWKIINLFQKLFGINPVCSCGAAHY